MRRPRNVRHSAAGNSRRSRPSKRIAPPTGSNRVGQQAHHGGRANRLAGAGFSDNAKNLSRVQRQRNPFDGIRAVGVGGQRQRQLLDR